MEFHFVAEIEPISKPDSLSEPTWDFFCRSKDDLRESSLVFQQPKIAKHLYMQNADWKMSKDDPKSSFYSRTYNSSNRKCNDWIQPTISTIKSGIPHRSGAFRIRMFMNIQSLNWPKIKLRLIFDFISNAVIGWWTSPKWKCFAITFWFSRKL